MDKCNNDKNLLLCIYCPDVLSDCSTSPLTIRRFSCDFFDVDAFDTRPVRHWLLINIYLFDILNRDVAFLHERNIYNSKHIKIIHMYNFCKKKYIIKVWTGEITLKRNKPRVLLFLLFIFGSSTYIIIKTYFELNLLTMILRLCLLYHIMLFPKFTFSFFIAHIQLVVCPKKTFKVVLIPEECFSSIKI